VRRIPRGQVSSYGRIAQMLGRPNGARAVGYALHALRDQGGPAHENVPWQRVINSYGRISLPNPERQAELLRGEGVVVSDDLRVNLDRYLWPGLHWTEIDDILSNGEW
jgi:methylated-DNA-protein-cysteine methyltransferase-like protein